MPPSSGSGTVINVVNVRVLRSGDFFARIVCSFFGHHWYVEEAERWGSELPTRYCNRCYRVEEAERA